MPNLKASAVLAAMEGDEMVEIAPQAQVVAEPTTAVERTGGLTEEDERALFLLMLAESMGIENFNSFAAENATELEVYGIVPSAEELRNTVSVKGNRFDGIRESAAIALAASADSPLIDAYNAALDAQTRALAEIVKTYGEAADRATANLINKYMNLSNAITSSVGDVIVRNLDVAAGEFGASSSVERHVAGVMSGNESNLDFITTDNIDMVCTALEHYLSDEAAMTGYSRAYEGIGDTIKAKAGNAWELIKKLCAKLKEFILSIPRRLAALGNKVMTLVRYGRRKVYATDAEKKFLEEFPKKLYEIGGAINNGKCSPAMAQKYVNSLSGSDGINEDEIRESNEHIGELIGEFRKWLDESNRAIESGKDGQRSLVNINLSQLASFKNMLPKIESDTKKYANLSEQINGMAQKFSDKPEKAKDAQLLIKMMTSMGTMMNAYRAGVEAYVNCAYNTLKMSSNKKQEPGEQKTENQEQKPAEEKKENQEDKPKEEEKPAEDKKTPQEPAKQQEPDDGPYDNLSSDQLYKKFEEAMDNDNRGRMRKALNAAEYNPKMVDLYRRMSSEYRDYVQSHK